MSDKTQTQQPEECITESEIKEKARGEQCDKSETKNKEQCNSASKEKPDAEKCSDSEEKKSGQCNTAGGEKAASITDEEAASKMEKSCK